MISGFILYTRKRFKTSASGEKNIEFLTIFKLAKALEVEISTIAEYDGPLPDNAAFKGLGKVNAIYSKRKRKSLK